LGLPLTDPLFLARLRRRFCRAGDHAGWVSAYERSSPYLHGLRGPRFLARASGVARVVAGPRGVSYHARRRRAWVGRRWCGGAPL